MKQLKSIFKKKPVDPVEVDIQGFLDMVSPSIIKFFTNHFICGNTYRCVWAIREYPTSAEEQALLRHLGEKENVTLKIYSRLVTPTEEKRIITNATNKNKMKSTSSTQVQETIEAQSDIQDLTVMIANMHRTREPLVHCAVFIEMIAPDLESLTTLQSNITAELVRSKMNVDKLLLRQKEGFLSVAPSGQNMFRDEFERVLPASSVSNLFPFNYSGKTDEHGFYLGKDKFGSNIIVDFNKRSEDKTNSNIIILGNSGQGKSYLLKLMICNMLESGVSVIVLDPESEYQELTHNLNGDYIDLTSGQHIINVLEPKRWTDELLLEEQYDETVPGAFKQSNVLSQHISFLKDFFKSYKDLTDAQVDTIEIIVKKMYDHFNITDETDLTSLSSTDYPTLSDLYNLMDHEFKNYDESQKHLYSESTLREICLALFSICVGSESQYFNGHTNISHGSLVSFGVKGLLSSNQNLRNALLFNVLSYMSNELLTKGSTVGALDEFYLFLTNLTAVEYIRNFMKRVRKKDSAIIIASQNLEDFNLPKIKEYTKPLFSIPTHQFLFNAGSVDKKFYIDTLQLEESEFELIRYPQRGVCLYKCGNERYNLQVQAPEYKQVLFGKAGGR
ncbi:ATP-binding protein [Erysipelothrix rhusiopathiae]|nr:ATP-binding protein [Erysipelothrix rhusiopathiae]